MPRWVLVFTPATAGPEGNVGIDIDEPGWVEVNKPLFREPGTWFLAQDVEGELKPIFCVICEEGDQFYFTKRHVGNLMAAREVVALGIGKKRSDGVPVNLWLLPNGLICGGEDVDVIASRMIG